MTYLKPAALTRKVINPLVSVLRTGGVATLTVAGRATGQAAHHTGHTGRRERAARYLVSRTESPTGSVTCAPRVKANSTAAASARRSRPPRCRPRSAPRSSPPTAGSPGGPSIPASPTCPTPGSIRSFGSDDPAPVLTRTVPVALLVEHEMTDTVVSACSAVRLQHGADRGRCHSRGTEALSFDRRSTARAVVVIGVGGAVVAPDSRSRRPAHRADRRQSDQ